MERLLPDPAPIELQQQLESFEPRSLAGGERPFVYTNFAVTIDGHATLDGRSGAIGSDTDTAVLMGLRESADAVLVGAGTIRAEEYGRLLPSEERRERREAAGREPDPVAVIVGNGLDLPWDAGLFSSGAGRIVVFTASPNDPPDIATEIEIVRHERSVDLAAALRYLREELGVEALLCEGGPSLHADLIAERLLDEMFVTIAPIAGGGEGPRMIENLETGPTGLELRWLLHHEGELFARYAVGEPED